MRPLSPRSSTAVHQAPESPRTKPQHDQPSAPQVHRLRDIDLKTMDKPYTNDEIATYLQAHGVRTFKEHLFDDCLFQSVLFTDFFVKIEANDIEPGDDAYDRPAQYLLKKSIELLQPLWIRIDQEREYYYQLLDSNLLSTEGREMLNKQLPHFKNMFAKFEAIERNLLDVYSNPRSFRPTRDKACLLLFVHALLSDAVTEMDCLTHEVAREGSHTPWFMPIEGESETLEAYLACGATHGDLFSPDPLRPEDAAFYKQCLTIKTDLGAEAVTVPSFSPTGSQGLLAILHAIFNRQHLLGAATFLPAEVHMGYYAQRHFSTLRHDCEHLEVMFREQAPSIAQIFEPIYQKLKNPQSGMDPLEVKADLVVLFFMLHENIFVMKMLNGSDANNFSFHDLAVDYFQSAFQAIDMIKLLNSVGFMITPLGETSTEEEIDTGCDAAASAFNMLWHDFRRRHAPDLSDLFAIAPGLLKN